MVKTGVTNVFSFLLDNDAFDADRVDNDRDLLRRFYLAHGYADMRVSSATSYDAVTKSVMVTFKIDEGPLYRFGKVGIESSVKSADAAILRDSLQTHDGDLYDADAVTGTVEALDDCTGQERRAFRQRRSRAVSAGPIAGLSTSSM